MTLHNVRLSNQVLIVFLTFLVLPAAALAHSTPCDHKHFYNSPDSINTCTNENAPCLNGNGICVTTGSRFTYNCDCETLPPSGDKYVLRMMLELSPFSTPAPNTTVTYDTTTGPNNFGELLYGDETVIPNIVVGMEGMIALSFGSFVDPSAVPVTVDEWYIVFPPGTIGSDSTGNVSTWLDLSESPQLIYNSITNELFTAWGKPLFLTVANSIHYEAPLQLLLTGIPRQEGVLQVWFDSPPTHLEGDLDNNGNVDGSDMAIFAAGFGQTGYGLQYDNKGWYHNCTIRCFNLETDAWEEEVKTPGRHKAGSVSCQEYELQCESGRSAECTNAADTMSNTGLYSECEPVEGMYGTCIKGCLR